MSKYGRIKYTEESNGASGQEPEYGAIFMSNSSTRRECLRRGLFGLPMVQAQFVKQVKAGMLLFLFDFETRELHGVFQASSYGAINIEPHAFSSSGKQFPAQVKFTEKWRCRPLREREFCHAISENYFTATKFNFGLSKTQVQRLLKLFSLKKIERSRKRQSADAEPRRKSEYNLQNTSGVCGFGNHCAGEKDGRVTSAGDPFGHRLTGNYDLGDSESYIGLENDTSQGDKYSGDTPEVFRRLVDLKRHESKDRLGDEFRMNNSPGTDALNLYSDYPAVDDRRVPKNLRHIASGWSEREYHEKYSTTQASSWSNPKEHRSFEADPVVPAQNSVALKSPYGTNTEYYDPCNPGIIGDGAEKSSRHDHGAPYVSSMGTASFTANSNYVLKEDIIPGGGYISGSFPSETVQPYADEHNDTSMNKPCNLGLDDYIPMPTAYPEYQANIGMFGGSRSGFEAESRNGHLHHSQFTGLLPSAGATENMRNFERLPNSSPSIFPSFAYPLSSRDLSPKDRCSNEISLYQHPEESGGHVSYSDDRVVRDSRIYPSFIHPSTSGDGADLYPENRTQNEVHTCHRHEEFGVDPCDSISRVIRMKDHVSPAQLERKRTRKSVFSRLTMPSKERDAEKGTSPDTESVDEVMAVLNECSKRWMEQKRPNMSNPLDFKKPKKKKEKILATEVLDKELMLPLTETTPDDDDLSDCETSMEHRAQKLPFIDFKRRSKTPKIQGNPTQGCQDSPEHSTPQNKKRKLLRPKLTEDDSEKDRGNNDNSKGNVLGLQSASEVLVHDFPRA